MDAAVTSVALAALAADGLLAGLSLDKVIVQLPARRRIGVTAYAAYARAADLGNGIAFYATVGVGAAMLTLAAFAVAAALGAPGDVTGLLAAAAALALLHSAATGRARSHHVPDRPGRRHRSSPDAVADTIRPLVSGSRSPQDRDPHRCRTRDRRRNLTGGQEETAMPPAPGPPATLDRAALRAEMEQARHDFRRLVGDATPADLRRPSDGTKWTNQQLLFHMLFGYLIVRALLVLVHFFGHLPDGASKAFARVLDAAHKPSDVINYLGSCAGARIIPPRRMPGLLDRVIAALHRHLDREPDSALRRGMHFPATWDPFFASYMTLAGIYHYPTQHFRFHQRQLTLRPPTPG